MTKNVNTDMEMDMNMDNMNKELADMDNELNDMSDGMLWVEDADSARLALSRALGVPEPVLYDDPKTAPVGDYDIEKSLGKLIDLQERMAKGMVMIQECKDKLAYFQDGNEVQYSVFMKWVKAQRKLWSHWFFLKGECAAIAEKCPAVWPKYFQIVNKEEEVLFDAQASKRSSPEVDNRMLFSDEAYFMSHMEEEDKMSMAQVA